MPLAGDVIVREVAGPLEKESGGVAVEGVAFCDCEGRRRRGGGEDRVRETGLTKGGVMVGGDVEGACGLYVCSSVGVCVGEGNGDCAVSGDEDAIHFGAEGYLYAGGDGGGGGGV